MRPEADWQNYVLAGVVHALIGGISPNVRAISFRASRADISVTVDFALATANADDDAEIADFVSELGAQLPRDTSVSVNAWVGEDWAQSDWPGLGARMVYAAKSSSGA